jgi:branched-chain amino acid transport system ATP-binding protein
MTSVDVAPATDERGGAGEAVLRAEGVDVSFGGARALADVTVEVRPGEVVGLIGPNGAGKSTLVKVLAGLVRPDRGRVLLRGRDISRHPAHRRFRAGIGMTFQTPRYAAELTVEEQLLSQVGGSSLLARRRAGGRLREELAAVVDELDLRGALSKYPPELPLGEMRRFEIARALMRAPDVLLVDEPASGMSAEEAGALAQQLRSVADGGRAVLLIEHNIPFVMQLARRIYVLDLGRVILEAGPAEVMASAAVWASYLGEDDA